MTTPTETINIVVTIVIVAMRRISESFMVVNSPFEDSNPATSKRDIAISMDSDHIIRRMSVGITITITVMIPNTPTVLLIRLRLDISAEYVSLTVPPTTGRLRPTTKRTLRVARLSAPSLKTPFRVTMPEKTVPTKLTRKRNIFLMISEKRRVSPITSKQDKKPSEHIDLITGFAKPDNIPENRPLANTVADV
jgi:hypothetical protein